jgi:putative inorganic carbon (hco3(-)) transporter
MFSHRRRLLFSGASFSAFIIPFLASIVLGCLLLVTASMGTKWVLLFIAGALAGSVGLLFPDRRLFAVTLLAACVQIGFQYNVFSHGQKFSFIDHFGGALPEPVIHFVDLPIFLLFGFWILDLSIRHRPLPRWTGTDTLIACLIAACLPSLYVTEEPKLFFFELFRYFKYLGLYWVLRSYLDRPAYFWAILGATVAVLPLQGLVSMLQYFLLFQLPVPVGGVVGSDIEMIGNEVILRVTGVLGHCNTFSAFLSVACAFGFILMLTRIHVYWKSAILPCLGAGLIALVLTFSRNGWMVFVVNACLIGFWSWRTGRLQPGPILSAALALILLVAVLFASGVMDTAFTRIFRSDGRNFDSRWDLMAIAWEMIKTHPFTGIGLNSFEESMIRFDPRHITHIIRQPVHNGFLLVASETGLPSLFFLIATTWAYVKISWNLLHEKGELHFAVGMAGLMVFVGLGMANLFDVTLRKESIAGLVVVTAAMLESLRHLNAPNAERLSQNVP